MALDGIHADEPFACCKQSEGSLACQALGPLRTLATALAHEIGSPLQVISASAELLLLNLPASDPRCAEARSILAESERIARVVVQLLGSVRPSPRGSARSAARIAMQDAAGVVRARFEARGIDLAIGPAEGLPMVAATREVLQQVLLNVLLRAGDLAGREGQVLLTARRAEIASEGLPGSAVSFAVTAQAQATQSPPEADSRSLENMGLLLSTLILSELGGEMRVGPRGSDCSVVEILVPAAEESP